MIIEPDPAEVGDVAARLLAAADVPTDVLTVTGDRGVAFHVPDHVAAAAGFGLKKPGRRKTAPKDDTAD